MITVLCVFGTRPEAIKLAPVIIELKRHSRYIRTKVCVTAQHRHMLDQVLDLFGILPDYDLNLMKNRQALSQLTADMLTALEPVLNEAEPDWVLIQGDTTTAMVASLMAFYRNIKIGHVEAGLRTYNKHAPFPEEINRRIISLTSDLNFAPTERAKQALLAEGIPETSIHVTGNTVVDALSIVRRMFHQNPPTLPDGLVEALARRHVIVVTSHRRESFGEGLEQICLALRDLVSRNPDISIVFSVHLNPEVQRCVYRILYDVETIHLIEPLPYASFVWLMNLADIILTDSGGVQEEAVSLGKPLVVMRETTERPEGIEAGLACLVGVRREQILNHTEQLLAKLSRYQQIGRSRDLYGDGHAAARIAQLLIENH